MDELRHAIKIGRDNHRKKPKRRNHPVESWRQDLDTEITEGWTAHGQTNHLLKTIACYGRVFEGLHGQDLIDYTLRIAINCPGYEQYCRHQHEIERKVTTWARAVENYYWPLGTTPTRDTASPSNNLVQFNRQQSEDAQSRIKAVFDQMEQAGELPEQITARASAIAQVARVSQQTLYKYLALWHPMYLKGVIDEATVFSAVESGLQKSDLESPEPLVNKGLHPSGRYDVQFPQVAEPVAVDWLDEIAQGCRRQLQRLGWNAAQLVQFIAEKFDGRRRAQLRDDELVLLLYHLQSVDEGG